MPIVPLDVKRAALRTPGQRALYDFAWSDTIDLSKTGFNLSRPGAPVLDPYIPARATRGTSDDIYDAGTSLIGDTDHFYVWAWLYNRKRGDSTNIFGRGKDGSGTGWSVGFTAGNGAVSANIVLVNPITLQWTATNTVTFRPGWNFVAMVVQMTYGAEPSHISAIHERSVSRTGLTGHTQLRSSTIGSYVGAGASQGVGASANPIGAVGIKLVNGMTEAQALADLELVRRQTESAFR